MQLWLFFNYFYEAKDFHCPRPYHSWSLSFLPLALWRCFLSNGYLVFQETGSSLLMAISPQPAHHLPTSCLPVDVAGKCLPCSIVVNKKKTSFPVPRTEPSLYGISVREDKSSPSRHGREHRACIPLFTTHSVLGANGCHRPVHTNAKLSIQLLEERVHKRSK